MELFNDPGFVFRLIVLLAAIAFFLIKFHIGETARHVGLWVIVIIVSVLIHNCR